MAEPVALVDDQNVVRAGIRRLLESTGEFEVVAEAADGRTAIEAVLKAKPSLLVLDVWLPKLSGIDVIRELHRQMPTLGIAVLSQQDRSDIVESALREGASAYVHKSSAPEDLITALRAVRAGKCFVSPEVAGSVVHALSKPAAERSPASRLSGREREILQLIADGLSSKEVASDLGLSTRTVETHRLSMMNKLDIHKVAGLVRFALREGMIRP